MLSSVFNFLTSLVGTRYRHLLTDIDGLIASLKGASEILKDPFCNRVKIWDEIENDVERVKIYGKPVNVWIDEWVSYEFNDEAVLHHAIEAEIVHELNDLGIDDDELGIDDEDSDVYDDEPAKYEKGDYEPKDVFLMRKINELYKIRNKVVRSFVYRVIFMTACFALVYVAWPHLINLIELVRSVI